MNIHRYIEREREREIFRFVEKSVKPRWKDFFLSFRNNM